MLRSHWIGIMAPLIQRKEERRPADSSSPGKRIHDRETRQITP
jgi:hypothetical protein